ncbi:MAG TPA: hypothetical protein VFQ74_10090 [Pseudolysinimonas sp.]|nr:hypothetical protein [Pseudolysinimonas sp.]
MPRFLFRASAATAAFVVAAIALSGCTPAPTGAKVDDCAGVISKVLLTDDSATTVKKYDAADVPKIFNLPSSPTPTCYYSTVASSSQGGISYLETHRTLLYIGLSDSEATTIIASIRKTVSVKPWTVRYDYDTPAPTATPGATATPTAPPSTHSARWYYNFVGSATDDKGQLGYFLSEPISQGTAQQAGLDKPVNVLRVETDLRQVKK